ncbi:MAG TPA: hypothetical protein VKI00_09135 [Mycobacterium sp.]|nr:hypothetical protein [Mycobacterium sp.]HME75795.1 hypothetical protein [Mycobacterium sp.]
MSDDGTRMAAAAIVAVIEVLRVHEPSRDPDVRNQLVGWLIHRVTATP